MNDRPKREVDSLGMYYTPKELIAAMHKEIVYPAIGTGAFLVRIVAKLPRSPA